MRTLKFAALAALISTTSWASGFGLFGSPYGPGGLETVRYRAGLFNQMKASGMVRPSFESQLAAIRGINYRMEPPSIWDGYAPKYFPSAPTPYYLQNWNSSRPSPGVLAY